MATLTFSDIVEVLHDDSVEQLEVQSESLSMLQSIELQFDRFFEMMQIWQMQMLEAARESGSSVVATPGKKEKEVPEATGILGAIAAVTAALSGLALGFIDGLWASIKSVFKGSNFAKLAARIGEMFTVIRQTFSDSFNKFFGKGSKFATVIDDIILRAYVIWDDYIVKPLTKLGNKIKSFFEPMKPVFQKIGEVFSKLKQPFTTMKELAEGFGSKFTKIFDVFKGIGGVLGKLMVPIAIVMSIIDTVKGAIAGFQEESGSFMDKFISGFMGGVTGLINGLITMPLDLLKDGISWIAEKMGFENFSEILDSFSFSDLFKQGMETIEGFFKGIVDWFAETFSGSPMEILGNLAESIMNVQKAIVRAILPNPDTLVGGIASQTPGLKAVYEWAGFPESAVDALPEGSVERADAAAAVAGQPGGGEAQMKALGLTKKEDGLWYRPDGSLVEGQSPVQPVPSAESPVQPVPSREIQSLELSQAQTNLNENLAMDRSSSSQDVVVANSSNTQNNVSNTTNYVQGTLPLSRNASDKYGGYVGAG